MELKSKISTSIEQSKKLLKWGLKPETADMAWGKNDIPARPFCLITRLYATFKEPFRSNNILPAWSLSRLLELMPDETSCEGFDYSLALYAGDAAVAYYRFTDWDEYDSLKQFGLTSSGTIFDAILNMIDWLIKNNYFNKEYLCAKK